MVWQQKYFPGKDKRNLPKRLFLPANIGKPLKNIKIMKYVYLLWMLLALFVNCNGQKKQQQAAETASPPALRMPDIPSVLTGPAERAQYLMEHYWDHFDFSDTAYIHFPQVTEQALVDFLDIMPHTSASVVSSSIKNMLAKAEAEEKMFACFTALYEKYLYDPNSPMRNDEFFIPVLEAMIASPATKEKIRPAYLLELARRNRPGEKAADFAYTLISGKKATLHSVQSAYTLLFFYNPDCNNCREVSRQLQASPALRHLMQKDQIRILALYPDEDLSAWKHYFLQIPKEWINAYDATKRLKEEEIYDLKAIPTLYLLDKDKRVLLKDPTFEKLDSYLQQILSQEP
jgi:thiol-disulfide isomerase/thioredoxin